MPTSRHPRPILLERLEDRSLLTTYYLDADADTYGGTNTVDVQEPDPPPPSYVLSPGDCNDDEVTIHPGAVDIPDDNIDQDCDGFGGPGGNQFPMVVAPVPDANLSNGSAGVTIDLTTVFSDAEDGTNLFYDVTDNSDPVVLDAHIENGHFLKLIPAGGLGPVTITIRAIDNAVQAVEDVFTITVINNQPVVSISGPAQGVPGQLLSYTFSATDDSAADMQAGFTFHVNWGDNTPGGMATGQGQTLTHIYAVSGINQLTVGAIDSHGADSVPKVKNITVNPVVFQAGVLTVGGTNGADIISVRPIEKTGKRVALSIGGSVAGNFLPSKIVFYGNGGADSITIATAKIAGVTVATNVSARILGGPGNDTLSVAGSIAANLVSGDQGNDLLIGSPRRDILIGGTGADTLRGGGGDDVLVAGSTNHTLAELEQLLGVWAGAGTYAVCVTALSKTTGTGPRLNKFTVADDVAVDTLLGEAGTDWFLASTVAAQTKKDKVTRTAGETLTQLTVNT